MQSHRSVTLVCGGKGKKTFEIEVIAQRYAEEAQRNTKGLFWNADKTDLAEARGFFNFVVFNNFVENLLKPADFLAAARLFRVFGYKQ